MKKIIKLIFTSVFLFVVSKTHSQLVGCNSVRFEGVAPSPWAIDGQIGDWETILGPVSPSPVFPFGTNASKPYYNSYGSNDPDNPDPQADLRVLSTVQDDYNVYFYFRQIDNSNFPNKAFYFLDINLDGLMNNGEPVIAISFNSQKVHKLSLARYIPLNPAGDSIGKSIPANICTIDGVTMRGTIDETINSKSIKLLENEIFEAAITEDGYGVELSVPWRLISDYKYFTYHLALQNGGGSYNPNNNSDNAGGCGQFLSIIGEPDYEVSDVSISTITEGLSYRIDVTFKNLTPAELVINTSALISFKDIVQNGNLPIDETQFDVSIGNQPYYYFEGTFSDQPIVFSNITNPNAGLFHLAPLSTATISINITFPPNYSVQSAFVEIQPLGDFELLVKCVGPIGGGGKPINPVGFTVGDETPTRKTNLINQPTKENINVQDKKIHVYPNPSKGAMNVILPDDGPFDIALTNYSGKAIKKWSRITQRIFKLENIKPGFYLLNIKSAANRSVTKKILVN